MDTGQLYIQMVCLGFTVRTLLLFSHWVWLFYNPIDCSLPDSSVHRFSQEEYWSEWPFPSPGDLPDPGIEPASPAVEVYPEPPGKT